jgi:drug/metabolite transporter (DMT)-like permease
MSSVPLAASSGHPASHLYALGAIALWALLATLGVALSHVPPFLLTGAALVIGSMPAWPLWRQWRIALRHAPAVEANLVNYLWPLLIVVMAPLFLPGMRLRAVHVVAALAGFAGAGLAIAGGRELAGGWSWGYVAALGSAFIWASYSLGTRRVAHFPTAAIGLFGLVSGGLSLGCHWVLEPRVALSAQDWGLLALMGLGPLGAAFFLWDKALKTGDARRIGILSYLTPLASTVLLVLATGRSFSGWIVAAAALIIGAAVVGVRARV